MVRLQRLKKTDVQIDTNQFLTFTAALFIIESLPLVFPKSLSGLPLTGFIRFLDIIVVIFLIHIFSLKKNFLSINVLKTGVKSGILISLFLGVILFSFHFLMKLLIGKGMLNLFTFSIKSTREAIFLFMIGGIISPVAEELFFRGILYNYLRKNLNIFNSIIISSLIFALFHLTKGNLPFFQLAGGIIFALSYQYSATIMTPVIIHIIGNIFIFSIPILKTFRIIDKYIF